MCNSTFLFLNETLVAGTQKNRLNEIILLSTLKIFKILRSKIVFIMLSMVQTGQN